MKLKITKRNHKELQDRAEKNNEKTMSKKMKDYEHMVESSDKYKKMSRGAQDIFQLMPKNHGEYWRQNHAKSLGKKHSQKKNK